MNTELMRAIQVLARMPQDLADGLCRGLIAQAASPATTALDAFIHDFPVDWREPARNLIAAARASVPPVRLDALALAVQASTLTYQSTAGHQEVELVWSGPPVVQSTFRRTDRAWVDVIDGAQSSLWLASFSVGSVDRVEAALLSALDRGVSISLLFERSQDAEGALSYDGCNRFDHRILEGSTLYAWAPAKRPRCPAGNIALMHAKAVVADSSVMFVTSANLSGAALERNIEVGVIVRGGPQPRWLAERFRQLIECRAFEKIAF